MSQTDTYTSLDGHYEEQILPRRCGVQHGQILDSDTCETHPDMCQPHIQKNPTIFLSF